MVFLTLSSAVKGTEAAGCRGGGALKQGDGCWDVRLGDLLKGGGWE